MAKRKRPKPVKSAASRQPAFPPAFKVPPAPDPPEAGLEELPSAWGAYAVACQKHADVVSAMVDQHSRQRVTAADSREPSAYRAQHRPVPGDSGRVVEPYQAPAGYQWSGDRIVPVTTGQVTDSRGGIGAPNRAHDVLSAMLRNGTIDKEQYAAGRRFEEDFQRARFDPLQAPDLRRVPGQSGGETATDPQAAKNRVWDALNRVGGPRSSLGRVLWYVLGEGQTLTEYVKDGPGYMRPQTASALLVGALSVLASND